MNLTKLYETQGGLDYHIKDEKGLEGKDLMNEKLLALQVEIGELANEWRGFKFWSNDRAPRRTGNCQQCNGDGNYPFYGTGCSMCGGTGKLKEKDPLLEEYVDCLHFILSIGLEIEMEVEQKEVPRLRTGSITTQFHHVFNEIADFRFAETKENYRVLFGTFLGLGDLLKLTEDEIETAYLLKNTENHLRQKNGY